jgi:hypothetical protein
VDPPGICKREPSHEYGATMPDVKDNDTFWTLVGDFGPGILTIKGDEMKSRPLLPILDRTLGEVLCIVESSWLTGTANGSFPSVVSFYNEFTSSALHLNCSTQASTRNEDLAAAWNALCDLCYPEGQQTKGLVALRMIPCTANLWRLGTGKPLFSWSFVRGIIQTQSNG